MDESKTSLGLIFFVCGVLGHQLEFDQGIISLALTSIIVTPTYYLPDQLDIKVVQIIQTICLGLITIPSVLLFLCPVTKPLILSNSFC